MEIFTNINEATEVEYELPVGTYQIRFYLDTVPGPEEIAMVRVNLEEAGIDVKNISHGMEEGVPYLAVTYSRHAPGDGISFLPVAIIPLIGLGFIATLIGIGIFKWEDLTSGLVKVMLVGGGILIIGLALARKPAMKYLEKTV